MVTKRAGEDEGEIKPSVTKTATQTIRAYMHKNLRSADLSLIIYELCFFCYVNTDQYYISKPDDMGPGHFSHHGSLHVKADDLVRYLSNCTEEEAQSLAMCQRVAMFIATQQGTSRTTVVLCALWTPAIGCLLIQVNRAMTACEKNGC